MYYNQQSYESIPVEDRSLSVAFTNLLHRITDGAISPDLLYRDLSPADMAVLDWWSIVGKPKGVELDEMSDGEGWPTTNHAIVRQRRIDEEAAGMVDHYSLVADQRAQSIVDSLDGTIKAASVYGPILGWASYSYKAPEAPESVPEAEVEEDTGIHVMKPGENIWDVARSYNVPAANLIAENEIEDPRHVEVGTELFIPDLSTRRKESESIRYELLYPTRQMHVAREEGAKKWSFGGVKKWEDLYSTGRLYPNGTNLTIVAIAHVPIGEDTAAYYLDSVSLGDFDTTGLPRYTSGFNWQHLADGHVSVELEVTPMDPLVAEIEAELDEQLGQPTEVVVTQIVSDAMAEEDRPEVMAEEDETLVIRPAPLTYKSSFRFLNDAKKPVEYMFNEPLIIHEVDGRLAPKQVGRYDLVRLIGTFEKDGILWGRAAVRGYWYGIPMDKVSPEEEVYNTDVDLPTRIAMRGQLSPAERRMVWMAKTAAHYRRIVGWAKRKQKA